MNNQFTGITIHLNLKPDQINHSENHTNIIENFKNHESIQRIKLANLNFSVIDALLSIMKREADRHLKLTSGENIGILPLMDQKIKPSAKTSGRSFSILSSSNNKHLLEIKGNLKANPANIYLFKVNNRNTRKRCEIRSKLTIIAPERRHCRCSGVFIINFGHISHLFLVFLLLILNIFHTFFQCFCCWFEQANVSWEVCNNPPLSKHNSSTRFQETQLFQ